MCWGVGMSKERCLGSGEVWESVWVSGEVCWRERERCGERNGGSVVNCVRVWGPNTLPPTSPHSPHLSLHLPLPPPHPDTLCYTSSHTSSDISPSSPHTPTHFPTPIATSPSPSQSVAKLLATMCALHFHHTSIFFAQGFSYRYILRNFKGFCFEF